MLFKGLPEPLMLPGYREIYRIITGKSNLKFYLIQVARRLQIVCSVLSTIYHVLFLAISEARDKKQRICI